MITNVNNSNVQSVAETFKRQNFPSSCLENLSLSRSSLYFNVMTSALNSLTAFCGNILLGFTQILELLEETRHFGRKMMICIVLLSLARRKILISWWIVEQAALKYEIFNIKKGKIFNTKKAVRPSQQNPTSKRFTRSRRSSEMWAQTEETVSFNDSMTIYESASSVAVTFKHFRQFWEKRSIILRNFQKLVSFLVTCRGSRYSTRHAISGHCNRLEVIIFKHRKWRHHCLLLIKMSFLQKKRVSLGMLCQLHKWNSMFLVGEWISDDLKIIWKWKQIFFGHAWSTNSKYACKNDSFFSAMSLS